MRLLAGSMRDDGDDSGELPDTASVASGPGEAAGEAVAAPDASSSSQVKLSVTAQLGEVALFVSGRCAEVWWPAEVRALLQQVLLAAVMTAPSALRDNPFSAAS